MLTSNLIYIHGFNSSPQSWKARLLQAGMQRLGLADQLQVPELSHWPAQAMEQLKQLVAQSTRPVTLIGSSLGGYYANWLVESQPDLRAVLVNPAVAPYRLLEAWLGENENLYNHERYHLTREHLLQLQMLDTQRIQDPSRYLLLVQTADETLDYRDAVNKYAACTQFVQEGGSHGFEQFEKLIPAIYAFAEGRIDLPPATPLPVVTPEQENRADEAI